MKNKKQLSKEATKMILFVQEGRKIFKKFDTRGFDSWGQTEQAFVKDIAIAMFNKSKVRK